jgi:hypothetical protein
MGLSIPILEFVKRAAVGAKRFTLFGDRQKNARMRIPDGITRHWAVKRQVGLGDFNNTGRAGFTHGDLLKRD